MALDTSKHKNILIKILKDIYTDATISPILGSRAEQPPLSFMVWIDSQ